MLADADKLGVEHLVQFADLASVDVLVTDVRSPTRPGRALEASGIEVVVA